MDGATGDKHLSGMNKTTATQAPPALTGHDLYLFREGTHSRLYEKLGAHVLPAGGVRFVLWAPNAQSAAVIGDFNDWDPRANPMRPSEAGIWQIEIPQAGPGSIYKY